MKGYLDLKGLSGYSSYSVSTLKKLLRHPYYPLPHFVVSGKILVKVADFDAWIANFKRVNAKIDLDSVIDWACKEVGVGNGSKGPGAS